MTFNPLPSEDAIKTHLARRIQHSSHSLTKITHMNNSTHLLPAAVGGGGEEGSKRKIVCAAYVHDGMSARVNSLLSYRDANFQVCPMVAVVYARLVESPENPIRMLPIIPAHSLLSGMVFLNFPLLPRITCIIRHITPRVSLIVTRTTYNMNTLYPGRHGWSHAARSLGRTGAQFRGECKAGGLGLCSRAAVCHRRKVVGQALHHRQRLSGERAVLYIFACV